MRARLLGACCTLLAAGPAAAAPVALAPSFPEAPVPAGFVALSAPPPTDGISLDQMAASTHGTIQTGIATHGGRMVAGDAVTTLVPGVVDLDVGGSTGRVGDLRGPVSTRRTSAQYSTYHAAISVRPTADTQIVLSVSGQDLDLRPKGSQ